MKQLIWILLGLAIEISPVNALPMGPCESSADVRTSDRNPISEELRTEFLAIKADFGPEEVRVITDKERMLIERFEALTNHPDWFAPGVGKYKNAREAFESFFHGGNVGGLNGRTVAILTTNEVDASGKIVPFQAGPGGEAIVVKKQIRVVSGVVEDVTRPMIAAGDVRESIPWLIKVLTAEGQKTVPLHAVRRIRVKRFPAYVPIVGVLPDLPYSILPEFSGLRTAVDVDELNEIASSTWELFQFNLQAYNRLSTMYEWSPLVDTGEGLLQSLAVGQIISAMEFFEQNGRVVGLHLVVGEITGMIPFSRAKIGFSREASEPSTGVAVLFQGQDGKNRQVPVAMLQKIHRLVLKSSEKP